MLDLRYPPDSGIAVYYYPDNTWGNDEGEIFLDLKAFGFTALQRQTILLNMHEHWNYHYMHIENNNREVIEIFWE